MLTWQNFNNQFSLKKKKAIKLSCEYWLFQRFPKLDFRFEVFIIWISFKIGILTNFVKF